MKTHQTIILLIGACLCFVCAIYPPRKFSGGQPQVRVVIGNGAAHLKFVLPNAFIFADDFGVYQHPPDGYYEVVVDGGLLLAELALIISLSGILVLIPTFLSQAKRGHI